MGILDAPVVKGTYATSGLTKQAVYNVKDYGAKGDGTTDDAAAIQSAITACLVTGGTVYAPPGNYALSTNLLIVGSNLTFKGAGMGATVFTLQNEVNRECIVLGDAVTSCNDVNFSDFTLDGNSSHQTAGSLYSGGTRNLLRLRMDSQNGYGCFVERVHCKNGKQNGLSCESMAFGGFINCIAENMQQNGIWCENGSNWTMLNCQTRNCGLDNVVSGGVGIKVFSFGGFIVSGCDLKGDYGGGIVISNAGSGQVIGNTIYRAGWQGASASYAATGLYLGVANNVTVTANTIYGAYGHGMVLDDARYCIVSNNTFRRNGQQTNNTYSDIYFTFAGAASNYYNVISCNTFQNDTAAFYTNAAAYNINADSASAHYNNRFIGNQFDVPVTATVNNMFVGNYWGENHLGVNPVGTYNYGYFGSPTQIIDPVNGSVITGTGYNSNVTVTINDGKFVGQQFTFIYSQDVGNKQLSWVANVVWPGGNGPVFSGVANTRDVMTFTWDGTNWNGLASQDNTNAYFYNGISVNNASGFAGANIVGQNAKMALLAGGSGDNTNYIESGNAGFSGNVPLVLSGYNATQGSTVTLNFSTVSIPGQISGGATGVTQNLGDNSGLLATDAYIQKSLAAALKSVAGATYLINTTDATATSELVDVLRANARDIKVFETVTTSENIALP